MRWTVVVPGALLPSPIAADVLASATLPWLPRALSRADVDTEKSRDGRGAAHLSWLWCRFGGTGDPVTGPYALRAVDASADPGAQCWQIDPVHFAFARDHLLVTPLDDAPPTAGEQAVLAGHLRAALDEVAGAASPRLHEHAAGWTLSLGRPWSLRATPLDGASGRSVQEHWPEGADAAAWRKLLTDVQMRWHAEPVNERREANGLRAVNAVWLHGGGAWAALPSRPFAAVVGADPVLRGWALAAGLAPEALHAEGAVPSAAGDVVSIRRDLLLPAQFEAWGQWLARAAELDASLQALQASALAAGYDELVLALCGRREVRRVRIRRGDRWRLWRRANMARVLVEAIEASDT